MHLTVIFDSFIRSLRSWTECASFVVLRLTELSKGERAAVASYAYRNLKQIPYSLTAGMWDEQEDESEEALFEVVQVYGVKVE